MKVNFVDSMKASHIFKDNFYALYQIKCILERILKDYININTFKINIVPYENNSDRNPRPVPRSISRLRPGTGQFRPPVHHLA